MDWRFGFSFTRIDLFVLNNYNRIAWLYDTLASWVFRDNIFKSQQHFISYLMPHDQVIIIGGGSGKILESINGLNIPLRIDFIEPSDAMIEKARKRILDSSNLIVNFHQTRFEHFEIFDKYDWVCCFYFLDLFNKESLRSNLERIKRFMHERSGLIVSDFQNIERAWWKTVLSGMMHCFFKYSTNLESSQLKDINGLILDAGFRKEKVAFFFSKFIFSAFYRKEVS